MTFLDVIALFGLLAFIAVIVLATFIFYMIEQLSHEDRHSKPRPHSLRANDEKMDSLLYRVGMESDTAQRHMHTLCRLLDVSYPPNPPLPTLTKMVNKPERKPNHAETLRPDEFQIHQKR